MKALDCVYAFGDLGHKYVCLAQKRSEDGLCQPNKKLHNCESDPSALNISATIKTGGDHM